MLVVLLQYQMLYHNHDERTGELTTQFVIIMLIVSSVIGFVVLLIVDPEKR